MEFFTVCVESLDPHEHTFSTKSQIRFRQKFVVIVKAQARHGLLKVASYRSDCFQKVQLSVDILPREKS